MPKKKSKKGGKRGSQKPQKKDEDDFDPLKDAVIDDEFSVPTAVKSKKKSKPSKSETKEAPPAEEKGGLSSLKSKATKYKVSSETLSKLEEEGLEDGDLVELGEDDLTDLGLSEEQAKSVAKAVRGEPVEEGPLAKLRAVADAHGITEETLGLLQGEELTEEDIVDLESGDLEDMGLSPEQAKKVIAAAKGEEPAGEEDAKEVKLPRIKEKAEKFRIDDKTIELLENEGLEESDMFDMEKQDFKDIGLKIGQIVRLMKLVKEVAEESPETKETPQEPEPKPEPKQESKKPGEEDDPFAGFLPPDKGKGKKESGKKGSKKKGSKKAEDDDDDPFKDFITEQPKQEEKLSKKALKRLRQKEKAKAEEEAGAKHQGPVNEHGWPLKEDGTVDEAKLTKKQRRKYKEKLKKEEDARKKAAALEALKKERERLEREAREKVEAEKRRIEEEKRREEEEKKRKEEEKKQRALEKKRRRQEMKKQGLILTKKQKEERRKMELARKRLEKMGVSKPGDQAPGTSGTTKRASDNRRNRRGGKPKSKKLQALADAEKAKREAEAAAAAQAEKEKQDAAEAAANKDDGDDDGVADSWDAGGDDDDVADAWDAEPDEDEVAKKAEEEAKRKAEEEKAAAEAKAAEEAKKAEEEKLRQEQEKKTVTEKAKSSKKKGSKKSERKDKRKRELRSPICCILGHVDTGKTKLLDKMRSTNVQDREAGGITQQIGATYFPMTNIEKATQELVASMGKPFVAKVPGLLMIDTPGHESFTNLRARGSNLCDIAILVVDIMHSLEPQTLESIRLLKERNTPFIVALNKVDRLFEWKSTPNGPIRLSLKKQPAHVRQEFETRTNEVIAAFAKEAELNTVLYYKNKNPKEWISLVPTSAHTGEGIPDLLWLLVRMTQGMMKDQITVSYTDLQCTVLEVKKVEGLGTTIDVVLVNGILREGDTIVVCGLQGPIVTTIRALLTPPPMKEIRVKAEYVHHKEIKAAMGVKITANGLEHAVAGTQLLVCGPKDDIEDLKDESMSDLASILSRVDPSGQGVYVQASTLGSLEALLQFLEDSKVPVSGLAIGPVHKKDVMKAAVMREHREEYSVILAFDVPASAEAKQMANEMGVQIFTADIIYHLFDMVTKYFKEIREKRRAEAAPKAVFPCVLKILPEFLFNKRSPIVIGVEILDGILRKGTPLCVTEKLPHLDIGQVTSIEFEHKERNEAKKGEQVCIKIDQMRGNQIIQLGRHFDVSHKLYSKLTRESIKLLKENFKEDLQMDDWKLVVKLKKVFGIIGKS